MRRSTVRNTIYSLLAVGVMGAVIVGCATTFVPISWGMREEVLRLSHQDEVSQILFHRYDPERKTLRVDGASFDFVDMPHSDWRLEGAYRQETRLIYRNLEIVPDDRELRNIMVHEMAHHIWFYFLSKEQKEIWCHYLKENPTRWQAVVRKVYQDKRLHDSEDFAYAVEFPRHVDIGELVRLGVITEDEMRRWEQAAPPQEPWLSTGAMFF
ncbi:MAG TPA: hypothetical protein VF775_04950 [Geobacteraceae bacterium]